MFTGLRRGELLARWGSVDPHSEKVIKVREALEQTKAGDFRFKAPKTRAGRRDVILPGIVIEALREHRAGNSWNCGWRLVSASHLMMRWCTLP